MTEPVPVAPFPSVFGGVQQLRPDVFRVRLPLVNIFLLGAPGGDWVLVDAGMPGTAGLIRQAAAQVYGSRAPRAIVLTHGHFDHIGALHALLAELPASWRPPMKSAFFAAVRAEPGRPAEAVIRDTYARRTVGAGA